jgi:hypothetical protein
MSLPSQLKIFRCGVELGGGEVVGLVVDVLDDDCPPVLSCRYTTRGQMLDADPQQLIGFEILSDQQQRPEIQVGERESLRLESETDTGPPADIPLAPTLFSDPVVRFAFPSATVEIKDVVGEEKRRGRRGRGWLNAFISSTLLCSLHLHIPWD